MFKHFCTVNFNTRTATQTRSKYTRVQYKKKWKFKHFCTDNFNVWVAVRVLKLTVQKCLNFHFFIYFRHVYLLLVCVAVQVLKSTVQKCLNIHFFIIKKWMFKHFCTVDFNTCTATQTRSKYTRLQYIKKMNV
jgi:hypothetical protein